MMVEGEVGFDAPDNAIPGLREVWEDARAWFEGDRTRTAKASCGRVRGRQGETWVKTHRAAFVAFRALGVKKVVPTGVHRASKESTTAGVYLGAEILSNLDESYRTRLSVRQIVTLFDWHLRWEAERQTGESQKTPGNGALAGAQRSPTPSTDAASSAAAVAIPGYRLSSMAAWTLPPEPVEVAPPSAWDLHLGFVLDDGRAAFESWLPCTLSPEELARLHVASLESNTPGEKTRWQPDGEQFLRQLVASGSADIRRLHGHSAGHPLWGQIAAWLPSWGAYLQEAMDLVGAWYRDVASARAEAGVEDPVPADFFEALMILVSNRPLVALSVTDREVRLGRKDTIIDIVGHGYLKAPDEKRTSPSLFDGLHRPMGQFYRMPVGASATWNRTAGELQERLRRAYDGTPAVLALCTHYAKVRAEREALVHAADGLSRSDLAGGTCNLCPPASAAATALPPG